MVQPGSGGEAMLDELPIGAGASWFGETGIKTERGVREAALATAWNWSETLWADADSMVPFGLFED
eukprot:scaffold41857_cov85-Phaeocystis_antarctica.AAC.1